MGKSFYIFLISIAAINACTSIPASTPTSPPPTTTVTPPSRSTEEPRATATVALEPQDFYGIWSVYDADAGGLNYLTFRDNGTFMASHGPQYPALILHNGTYTLDGNEITFNDWWYCSPDQLVGVYIIHMTPDKQSLRFLLVDDPCKERAYDFTKRIVRWKWFLPTRTPTP